MEVQASYNLETCEIKGTETVLFTSNSPFLFFSFIIHYPCYHFIIYPRRVVQKVITMSLRRRNDWSNPLILKGFKIDCFPFSILRASAHHARN